MTLIKLGSLDDTNCVIFLHGYNQTAANAKQLFQKSIDENTLKSLSMFIYFPSNKWFTYVNDTFNYVKPSLTKCTSIVIKIINNFKLLNKNVLLIGYSQGACLALHIAHKIKIPILSISGFLMNKNYVQPGEIYTNTPPIWYTHGTKDTEIPFKFAEETYSNTNVINKLTFNGHHWNFWEKTKFKVFIQKFFNEYVVNPVTIIT